MPLEEHTHDFIADNEDGVHRLEAFINDYANLRTDDVSKKWGVSRTVAGNGASLLKHLGFNLGERSKAATARAPSFDTAEAARLFDAGVDPKEIAGHLKVKTISVTAYLKRIGKIRENVPLAQVLGQGAAAVDVAKAA